MKKEEIELVERLAELVAKLQMVNCGVLSAKPYTQSRWRGEIKEIRTALESTGTPPLG